MTKKLLKSLRTFLESQSFVRISLKKTATQHFKVNATINGVSGVFIVDTGASNSCIGFSSINYFKMKAEDTEIKAAGAGATNMHTQISHSNTLCFSVWKKNKMSFIIIDLSHVNEALESANETAVHGIIGADLLKKGRAVIDYGRNCLYLKQI